MSRKPKAAWTMNFLFSLSLQSMVLASGPNIGQDQQNPLEVSYRPEEGTNVTVLVHNYAHLPEQILVEAQERASLIFRKAGVAIEWANCPLNDEDPAFSVPRFWMRLSFFCASSQKSRPRWILVARLS